jgi:hypothetical protein
MIKSIKTKELNALIRSWEAWAEGRLAEHKIEPNWNNYYSAAGLLTAAEELKKVIRIGYFETGDKA